MEELQEILRAGNDAEHRRMKFAAALKGVDLDSDSSGGSMTGDDVKRRVEAKLQNKSEESLDFAEIGISVVTVITHSI